MAECTKHPNGVNCTKLAYHDGPCGSDVHDFIPAKRIYEAGQWIDGRWGQAYDLVSAALKDAGHDMGYDHPVLHILEMEGNGAA